MSRVVTRDNGIRASTKTIAINYDSTVPGRKLEIESKECTTPGSSLSTLRVIQSPMEAWLRMASPFRNFLGLLKPPTSLQGYESTPRATESSESLSLKRDVGTESSSSRQSVVVVAFNANNVRDVSHAGIVWAMEHVLKGGDTLTIVSVVDSVRGPWGNRVKIGDAKWVSANQNLIEEEVQQKMEVWRSFPGLDRRCAEGGVKLVVMVKAARRVELAICHEAMKLGACHVVLDSSLKNRRREVFLQNLSCNVTRMRRHGGVDVIRPSLDMAMLMGLVPCRMRFPRSPTSVLPKPRLSYGDQIDEFEISLNPKRLTPKYSAPRMPSPKNSSSEESKLRRLPSFAKSAHELSISSSSTSTSSVPSFVSQPSFTSSSGNDDMDDDLFSICHGSTRHTEIDTDLFSIVNAASSSGYESDDLFSIGDASSRRTLPAAAPPEYHHSRHLSFSSQPLLGEPLDSAQN